VSLCVCVCFAQEYICADLICASGVGKDMAKSDPEEDELMEKAWAHLGQHHPLGSADKVTEMLRAQRKKAVYMS